MKPRVYLETTIPSFLTAWPSRDLVRAAHQQITTERWGERRDNYDLFVDHSDGNRYVSPENRRLG
jgi:hypothetical protein